MNAKIAKINSYCTRKLVGLQYLSKLLTEKSVRLYFSIFGLIFRV